MLTYQDGDEEWAVELVIPAPCGRPAEAPRRPARTGFPLFLKIYLKKITIKYFTKFH
jgi:hypothetical protein